MSTDKISRLQSLLDRIKRNAGAPKRPLGSNLGFGGTQGARSDISTGPSVPAASVAKPKETPALNDIATPRRPPLPPITAAEVAPRPHEPAAAPRPYEPAAAPRTPTLSGAARVPTMSGGPIGRPSAPEMSAKPPPTLEVIEELDFDDAEVIDITSDRPPPAEISSVGVSHVVSVEAAETRTEARAEQPSTVDIDDLHWSEPPTGDRRPPDSSPRPRAAGSLNEALAGVNPESVEPPIKTPPPESGRQPLEGVYAAPIPEARLPVPTVEQLGETLDLEAPTAEALELDLVTPKVQKAKEELEFELPPRASVLEPPAFGEEPSTLTQQTAEPTSRHRAPEQSHTQISNLPDDGDTIEMAAIVAPDAPAPSTDRDNLTLTPSITERTSPVQAAAPEFIHPAHKFAPKSFAELLDASLKLG